MLTIKVLGGGCANCNKLEELARSAVDFMRVDAEFIKVTEMDEIMGYGVLNTPGLVINEKVVTSGRLPTEAEISTMIADALETL